MQRHRDEPLLGAVVEVALEAPPLGVAGLDDASARLAQIVDVRTELGVEPLVLERQSCRRRDRLQELRRVAERRIVHERRDAAPVPLDHASPPGCFPPTAARTAALSGRRSPGTRRPSTRGATSDRRARGGERRGALPASAPSRGRAASSATLARASRLRRMPARMASGTAPKATKAAQPSARPAAAEDRSTTAAANRRTRLAPPVSSTGPSVRLVCRVAQYQRRQRSQPSAAPRTRAIAAGRPPSEDPKGSGRSSPAVPSLGGASPTSGHPERREQQEIRVHRSDEEALAARGEPPARERDEDVDEHRHRRIAPRRIRARSRPPSRSRPPPLRPARRARAQPSGRRAGSPPPAPRQ